MWILVSSGVDFLGTWHRILGPLKLVSRFVHGVSLAYVSACWIRSPPVCAPSSQAMPSSDVVCFCQRSLTSQHVGHAKEVKACGSRLLLGMGHYIQFGASFSSGDVLRCLQVSRLSYLPWDVAAWCRQFMTATVSGLLKLGRLQMMSDSLCWCREVKPCGRQLPRLGPKLQTNSCLELGWRFPSLVQGGYAMR